MAETGSIPVPAVQRRGTRSSEVDRYLRRAGLPELCPRHSLWLAWAVAFLGAFVVFLARVTDAETDSWSEAQTVAVNALGIALFSGFLVTVVNGLALHRPRHLATRAVIWLVIAAFTALDLYVAVQVARGGLGKSDAYTLRPGNLTLALLAAVPALVAIVGGLSLLRATLVGALSAGIRDVSSVLRTAAPEMLFLVVFVVILRDVWHGLAPLDGWRVEILLLGCVVLATAAIAVRIAEQLRAVTSIDATQALELAARDQRASALVRGATPRATEYRLRGRARWNAILLVVLPLTVRLIVAAALLTALLFIIGLLLSDTVMGSDLTVPREVAAAKVAALLSGLAAVGFAVGDRGGVFAELAERRVAEVRTAVAVWALRCDDATEAAPAR